MKDYYAILGVPRNASDKEIRQAYRRLARQLHPDLNPGDKEAEERFKLINEAYEVLSDPEKRRKYDMYGENWKYADQFAQAGAPGRSGGPFDWLFRTGSPTSVFDFSGTRFGDLFEELLGDLRRGSRRVTTLEYPVEVSLEEAYSGTVRQIEVDGRGPRARRRLEVRIPPGVDNGSRIHISAGGGQEVYLVVRVREHPRFQRKGDDLYTEVPVPLVDAVLGGEVEVPTLRGGVILKIPPETQNGQVFRLAGKGMPRLGAPNLRGDLYVTARVVLPKGLTERERRLFEELRSLRSGRRW